MLICPRCEIEYDNAEGTCGACGSPLVTVRETQAASVESEAKELRVCPKCNMLYRKETTCLRCGTGLVTQTPSQEGKDIKIIERPEKRDRYHYQAHSSGKNSETPLRASDGQNLKTRPFAGKKAKAPLDDEREVGKTTTRQKLGRLHKTKPFAARVGSRDTVNSGNTFSPGTLAMVAFILLVVVAGYFLLQRAMIGKPMATTITMPIRSRLENSELGKIHGLLNNIQLANLREDIELFISCYAKDFRNREAKKQSTLESWKASDYLDLSYSLRKQSISEDTAHIEVEWLMKISQKINGQLEEGRIVVDALLKKEGDSWKIKEIKTIN